MESPPCQDCGEAQLHPSLFSKHETSDIQDQVSLLDVLPEYLALGALVPREIAGHWMGNAVRLMLHSALEQVFVYKKGALKDLIQAFAWDWEGPNVDPDEFDQWKSLRDSTRSSFIGSGASPVANLKQLSLKNPVREFEEHILDQLKQLLGILPAPALKTLESRTLPGLTKAQMTAFSSRIGLY